VELRWYDRPFEQLSPRELYAILALRSRVFVVEQRCLYLDADGVDLVSRHLWAEQGEAIVAYLRIVPAGVKFPEVSLGRVITAAEVRGTGLGRELMRRGIEATGHAAIRIAAQAHLERFYGGLGFSPVGAVYLEDDIPHQDMIRPAGP
jgi:ElaA protein